MGILSKRGKRRSDNNVNLKCPKSWLLIKLSSTGKTTCTLCFCTILALGVFFQYKYPFPYFYVFVSLFLFIGSLCIFAERHYCREIQEIGCALKGQKCVQHADYFMKMFGTCSSIFVVVPILTVLTFGIGGCMIFGAIKLTPSLIWILGLFAIVVYISIVGYIQYIFLAIYIFKVSNCNGRYTKLQKKDSNYIPADITWLQRLTKLSHLYRSVFFTLGCTYIAAFSAFCYLPAMDTNKKSFLFITLWGIIVVAIVLAFPLVSVLERRWIKKIVYHLKKSYIFDLEREAILIEKSGSSQLASMLEAINVRQVLDSKDYPLNSVWSAGYAAILAIINFVTTATTIFSDTLPLINELQRFFLQ